VAVVLRPTGADVQLMRTATNLKGNKPPSAIQDHPHHRHPLRHPRRLDRSTIELLVRRAFNSVRAVGHPRGEPPCFLVVEHNSQLYEKAIDMARAALPKPYCPDHEACLQGGNHPAVRPRNGHLEAMAELAEIYDMQDRL